MTKTSRLTFSDADALREHVRSCLRERSNALLESTAFRVIRSDNLTPYQCFYIFQQYGFYCNFFPRALAFLCARIEEDVVRMPLIQNLWEEHGEGTITENHRYLYQQFLERLASKCNIPQAPTHGIVKEGPAVSVFVSSIESVLRRSTLMKCLGFLGPGTEDLTGDLYTVIATSLRQRFALTDLELEFFLRHIDMDCSHAALFWDVIYMLLSRNGFRSLRHLTDGAALAINYEIVFWNAVIRDARLVQGT